MVVGAIGPVVGIGGTEWGNGRVVGTRWYAERGEVARVGSKRERGGELDDGKERSLTRAAGCRLLESYVARALPWPLLVCSAFVRNLVCAVRARQKEKEARIHTSSSLSLSLSLTLVVSVSLRGLASSLSVPRVSLFLALSLRRSH